MALPTRLKSALEIVLREITPEMNEQISKTIHQIEGQINFDFIFSTIKLTEEEYFRRKGLGSTFIDTVEEEGMVIWENT